MGDVSLQADSESVHPRLASRLSYVSHVSLVHHNDLEPRLTGLCSPLLELLRGYAKGKKAKSAPLPLVACVEMLLQGQVSLLLTAIADAAVSASSATSQRSRTPTSAKSKRNSGRKRSLAEEHPPC